MTAKEVDNVCRGDVLQTFYCAGTRVTDTSSRRKIQLYLVDIAPAPIFPSFERSHDRVLRCMKMLGRVFIFRRITTADVPANQAKPEVYPLIARFKAFFAAARVRLYISNLIRVMALGHVAASLDLLSGIRTIKRVSPGRDLKLTLPW